MTGRPPPLEHAISVVEPTDATSPLLTQLPTTGDSLSACAHLHYRVLMCKYRCGVKPTAREKHSIELARRRANRDIARTASTAEEGVPRTPDDFCVVDVERGRLKAQSPNPSSVTVRQGKLDTVLTVVFRFPLYILFVVFIALHDVIFDHKFRDRVKSTTACELLEDEDAV